MIYIRAIGLYLIMFALTLLHPIAFAAFIGLSIAVAFVSLLVLIGTILFVFIKHGFCKDFFQKVCKL